MACSERNDEAPGGVALLIVDMINDLEFEDAEELRAPAMAAAEVVLKLRDEADCTGSPVIYVNDNFGQWHGDLSRIVGHCLREGCPGRALAERMRPRSSDYFVIKPQVSGFYATNLAALLPRLRVGRLVLTGVATDICVLFTAADAHMREYDLWVPSDAVAASRPEHTQWALGIMQKSMGADVRDTAGRSLAAWIKEGKAPH